jgi:hypothetical protein
MAAITLLVLATESTEKNSHELTRMGQPPNNLIADCADCTDFISHEDAKAQREKDARCWILDTRKLVNG